MGIRRPLGTPSDPPPGITATVRYPDWFPCLDAKAGSDGRWWAPDVLVSVIMAALAVIARLRHMEKAERRRDPTRRVIGRRSGRSAGH